ncbi:hypothetical protein MMU07_14760 [Aquiflexum sp. LQ15W]|uniref:hypothetical protein n=1 Tax=Cognataquiflexum nitidum TaxID=2922272 RepID=UPI001F12ED69|nr:hypothetical protein [Cognataquiflexum nitidum]MCH6200843.1 hypothetical protein [Cognataquiflexum nitidum]
MSYYMKLLLFLYFFPSMLMLNIPQPKLVRLEKKAVQGIFSNQINVGLLENKEIDEASGMAFSRKHDGLIYTHNDSGGGRKIFVIDSLGKGFGVFKLKGVWNRDWEDIAVGPGPDKNLSYIYVGEIGDNQARYTNIFIYRIPEPEEFIEGMELEPEVLKLSYPDGAKDAETLMIDPISKDIFILSKRDSLNILYKTTQEAFESKEAVLEKVMELPFTMSVAGDISLDGKEILIKNYFTVYFWKRNENESVVDALRRDPVILPYRPEPQGEAIAFHPNGKSYFTLSEKRFNIEPVLYRYNRK